MAFHKLKLNQVFGISPDVPKHTYVDRNNLDQKFRYLLDSGSHLVIHGASKQGKTVLRRKNLPDGKCSIHKDIIKERLKHLDIEINSPLSDYLKRIDNLQSLSQISPIVLSYNTDSQKVQLVDYDLLFFRKYIGENNLPWSWLR